MLKNQTTITDWHNKLLEEKVIWKYPGYGPHVNFVLNNNHSDFYFNSGYLAYKPYLTREISLTLFKKINEKREVKPDWILTYPPFGLQISFCLAELFGSKLGFIKSLSEPEIYCGIKQNETALLCSDDLGSGVSLLRLIEAAKGKGAHIIDLIAVVVNVVVKRYLMIWKSFP